MEGDREVLPSSGPSAAVVFSVSSLTHLGEPDSGGLLPQAERKGLDHPRAWAADLIGVYLMPAGLLSWNVNSVGNLGIWQAQITGLTCLC